MVNEVVFTNNTPLQFQLQAQCSKEELTSTAITHLVPVVNPEETATLYHFKRKKSKEILEVEAWLYPINLQNPGDQALRLRQRFYPKTLTTKLEYSVSSQPYEAMFPEPQWAKGSKRIECVWTCGENLLSLKYFHTSRAGHTAVHYVLEPFEESEENLKKDEQINRMQQWLPEDCYQEEVYENQRGNGMSGPDSFNSKSLFKTERGEWTTYFGQHCPPKEYFPLPSTGWKWVSDWKIDRGVGCDPDGWQYATSWKRNFDAICHRNSFVRRRRWVRLRRRLQSDEVARSNSQQIVPTIREVSTDAKDLQDLIKKISDPVMSDALRIKMVKEYAAADGELGPDEVAEILNRFLHESTKVECFEALIKEAKEHGKDVEPLKCLVSYFPYHSHRRRVQQTCFD